MAETAVFDHYEVLKRDDGSLFELGRGAMGITYKAFDTNLRCHVALKVINAASIDSDLARQRFVREARAAAQLRHRHVASVFHLGVEGDTYFYAMEFIDGETVESLIRRNGPLDPVLALRIVMQVTRALGAAQKHSLVHRDIKPSNLMLVREDEELVVKVIDFGLAKSSKQEDESAALSMGGFVGTPHFASPEQLEEREIDVRSDIYSLGITLWYLLAGGPPFAGSLAQVMSHHLHSEPPFAQLKNLPEPVHQLLRHMLEKNPAKRPQSPAELRQKLEQCLAFLTGGQPQNTNVSDIEIQPSGGGIGQQDSVKRIFHTGALVAGRYEILEDLGEGNSGWCFRAKDTESRADVRIMALHSEWANTPETLTQIEREVEKLRGVEHPNLMRVYSIERVEDASFLVLEWREGFSLLELLRARRELTVEETLLLLDQAATGVDFAIQRGLKQLDLALHQIEIDFPNASPQVAPLLDCRVTQWPGWILKLNGLGITRELALSDTWAGGQTLVGGMESAERGSSGANPAGRYLQALGAIVYELLGGTLSPVVLGGAGAQTALRYVPLATLPEEGNEVLKQALDPARSFRTAEEFCGALKNSVAEEIRSRDATVAPLAETAVRVTPPPAAASAAFTRTRGATAFPSVEKTAPVRPEKNWWESSGVRIGAAAAAAVVVGATVAHLLHRPSQMQTVAGGEVASPTPSVATPAMTPLASTTPVFRPEATVPPKALATTPGVAPERAQLLKARITEAERYETDRDWARCIAAYASIARDFPEVQTGTTRLGIVINSLRVMFEKMSDDEFPRYVGPITESANLGVVSAMLILGEHLRKTAPRDAFNWFCAAATLGSAPAFAQVGLMYSNGAGVERDFAKAVSWFQWASDLGDPSGKLLLGECYLDGIGMTTKDETKAVALLQEAATAGEPRAMNKLGMCYAHGIGTTKNFSEAFRLFSQASEMNYGDATGNLGVLFINGDGVKADAGKAVELFRKGARDGNALCMFFLGQSLLSGKGVERNELEAELWIKKSAAGGNPLAVDWCQKNGVPVPH